jgi:hypothetical protein
MATSAISSKSRGKLARDEGAQKAIRKDMAVIQPHLEIVGRSLDNHRRLETRLSYFVDGIRADVVYQAERMRPLRPDKDVGAASDCLSRFNWGRGRPRLSENAIDEYVRAPKSSEYFRGVVSSGLREFSWQACLDHNDGAQAADHRSMNRSIYLHDGDPLCGNVDLNASLL